MNVLIASLTYLYSRLLLLYPGTFRNEFAEEMQVVFRDSVSEAVEDGILSLAIVCLRELGHLPASLWREFWYEFERKEVDMVATESVDPDPTVSSQTNRREALIGVLPFALFGLASLLAKIQLPFNEANLFLVVYLVALTGLFIGLINGVPGWTYVYLGWALIHSWWAWWWASWSLWWMAVNTQELKIPGFEVNYPGWQAWIPLLATLGAALVFRRSLTPLVQLVKGIWQDWTRLSLGIYTFVGWIMLLYDENHSPYLIPFMIASTLAISASVWVFMRRTKTLHRFLALLSGFAASLVITRICESTWDFAAYYGLPAGPSTPWYDSILDIVVLTGFWGIILFWPSLLGFVRRAVKPT